MRINIKATGVELTPAIAEYAEKKIATIAKFLNGADPVVQVEVGKTTGHHKHGEIFRAEVRLIGDGLDHYAVSEQADLYAAIDLVRDDVVQKLTHEKGKRLSLTRRGAQAVKQFAKGFNFFKKRS